MTSDASEADIDKLVQGKLSNLLSFDFINELVSSFVPAGASATGKQKQMLITSMFIERYYASVKEDVNPLAANAISLLQNEDYVGFFKSCGPNYVRGLRRAQEVTAVLEYESTSAELAKQFTKSVKNADTSDPAYESITETLTIAIRGYGMGVSQDGSETLVATSIQEYFGAMKFAFNSMTKAPNAHHIGMVYGMEVVPWVNNLQFNVYAQIGDKDVNIPLKREYIPLAVKIADGTTVNPWVEANRADFECSNTGQKIDKTGACCDLSVLKVVVPFSNDGATAIEDCSDSNLAYCMCFPTASLDKSMIRDNMSNNGEFVARLDSALRYKMAQLGTLEKCISAISSIPSDKKDNIIKQKDSVKYDPEKSSSFTVQALKWSLDPRGDYGLVTLLAKEMDEWIDQFYAPCLNDLYGMNKADGGFSYFMAYSWYTYDSCNKMSCLTNNMAWDSVNGGCKGSLTTDDQAYTTTGTKCKANPDGSCKNTSALSTYATNARLCWKGDASGSIGGVSYLIDNFCFPKVSDTVGAVITTGSNQCIG